MSDPYYGNEIKGDIESLKKQVARLQREVSVLVELLTDNQKAVYHMENHGVLFSD
jgi:hypothetical protein